MDTEQKPPPLIYLHYDKGELIIKEGDYGVSIYKIIDGQVKVFKQSGQTEIPLATLGPGEIFGEMTFLTNLLETRSASVRASDDVDVEVWHPARLSKEYDEMPPIIKYIVGQTLDRLNRMNEIVGAISRRKREEKGLTAEPEAFQRKYYRKRFDERCTYWPVDESPKMALNGQITDISLGGLGMDVNPRNARRFRHNPDDEFEITTILPSGKDLDMIAKIRSVKKDRVTDPLHLGLQFSELKGASTKALGFFMMS